MTLLRKAMNETAYLKAGILGFAGSGKTYTASELAIGLAKDIGGNKPVAFFDTETGSDFMIPRFRKAGIELLVAKTRSFADLLTFMKEAQESGCSVVVIDSITHVWMELQAAYKKRKKVSELSFQDWGPLKDEWRQFTDSYVNAPLHAILCGRAAFEYDFEVNDRGKKELVKTGTKMRAENEMGYEPSLLLEMERVPKADRVDERDTKGAGWTHRCYVLKDRTDTMNGRVFDDPKYSHFESVVRFLNIGAPHVGVDTSRNSERLFDGPDRSAHEYRKQVQIALEEIKDWFVVNSMDGTSADAKKRRVAKLTEIFSTSSWTAIESLRLETLREGLRKLRGDTEDDIPFGGPKLEPQVAPPAPAPAPDPLAAAAPAAALPEDDGFPMDAFDAPASIAPAKDPAASLF